MVSELLPPLVLELRAKAGELHTELATTKKELSELEHHTSGTTSKMSGAFQKTAGYGKTLALGIGGAAVAVGGWAVELATSAQVVDAKLSTAVKNAGGSMEELDPKISKVDGTLRKFGFTNDETNTSLATLTTALKDPEKALGAVSVAADLARAKHIDLNTASLMVAKAMEGQTRPLKALGIDLPVYAGNAQAVRLAQDALAKAQQKANDILAKTPGAANPASKAHAAYEKALQGVEAAHKKLNDVQSSAPQIMAALESRVHGMASAYGNTLQGKVASAKAGLEAMGESLGKKLIPVIATAIGWAQKFVGWLTDHTPVLYTIAGVIGTVVVTAIGAYIASLVKASATTIAKLALMVAGWFGYAAESSAAAAESAAATEASVLSQFATMIGAAVSGFASMVAAGAVWVAQTAAQMVRAVASGAVWIAQHVAMAAVAVVQYGIIAGAAVAAFVAENLATLGIIAGIALVIAAVVFLATHWKQAWKVITDAAKWAYDNVIRPVGEWIVSNVLHPIASGASWLAGVWSSIWRGIGAAAKWAYDNVIAPVARWIAGNVIGPIKSGISGLGSVWGGIWGGISRAVQTAWGIISGVVNSIIGAVKTAISWISSLGGAASGASAKAASSVNMTSGFRIGGRGRGPSKLGGGWLDEAPRGKPIEMTGHGGEYMLSVDMLEGRQKIDPKVVAAIAGGGSSATQNALNGSSSGSSGGGGPTVNVYSQTNASPHRIAADVGWALRRLA